MAENPPRVESQRAEPRAGGQAGREPRWGTHLCGLKLGVKELVYLEQENLRRRLLALQGGGGRSSQSGISVDKTPGVFGARRRNAGSAVPVSAAAVSPALFLAQVPTGTSLVNLPRLDRSIEGEGRGLGEAMAGGWGSPANQHCLDFLCPPPHRSCNSKWLWTR